MNLKDKRFLVAGLGRSGIAAAKLLKRMQISFSLFDGSPDFDRESFYEKNKELKGAEIFLGSLKEEQMLKTDILVLSPGIPADLPMVNDMRALGVWIWCVHTVTGFMKSPDSQHRQSNWLEQFFLH